MRNILNLLVLAASVLGEEAEVQDKNRACPDGFFYGGEVETVLPTMQAWEKGPRSPVYSCYMIKTGPFDWVNATKKCSKDEGQLLSVNNFQEDEILTGEKFLTAAFGKQGSWDDSLPMNEYITSGISLEEGRWTWFGAGESESSVVSDSILSGIETINSSSTYCLSAKFVRNNNKSRVSLEYSAQPCLNTTPAAICEVRVYEQVWYVWFTTNWLQILFLLTLVMLLISTCITFQIWVTRPNRRAREANRPANSPPAYSVTDGPTGPPRNTFVATADRYAEKGKELMAKVVFYRKPEDKQRLATDA